MNQPNSTPVSRRRRTSMRVRATDAGARLLITLAGIGTIVAVMTVMVMLVWVVIPLFTGSSMTELPSAKMALEPSPLSGGGRGQGEGSALDTSSAADTSEKTRALTPTLSHPRIGERGPDARVTQRIHLAVDEAQGLAWALRSDGTLELIDLANGKLLHRKPMFADASPTAISTIGLGGEVAVGTADGTIRLGRIKFTTMLIEPAEAATLTRGASLMPGKQVPIEGGAVSMGIDGQYRRLSLEAEFAPPTTLAPTRIELIDLSIRPDSLVIAALTGDGELHYKRVTQKKNLLTGKVTTTLAGGSAKVMDDPAAGVFKPSRLLMSGTADTVLLIANDGETVRIDTRDAAEPVIAETLDLLPDSSATITALQFLIGKTTLMVGDSTGAVTTWFRTRPGNASAADGTKLVAARAIRGSDHPIVALAASARTRRVAAAHADGAIDLIFVTTNQLLASAQADGSTVIDSLALSPKDDGLTALAGNEIHRWSVHSPHPETTLAAIFTPTWYEGGNQAEYVWQSTGGDDAFETKFGLVPLIFGTFKATLYAMLFGTPLAILAAIYTSEFLQPAAKARIKPVIETMASLPSVVLGFIAALVIAPAISDHVPWVIATLLVTPFCVLLGAHLWQLVPHNTALRLNALGLESHAGTDALLSRVLRLGIRMIGGLRIVGVLACLIVGVGSARLIAHTVERVLFAGDLKAWLDHQVGTGWGGWVILLLPLAAASIAFIIGVYINPVMRARTIHWSRPALCRLALGKFILGTIATIALAALAAALLTAMGMDPRGSIVGTYVQRNAMIVGFVMGFAVIPIIYTISEDALSAVPEHLRAASLGAGATPWQTAMRIIIPTAMSGLFSAVMIGLGRAIGETMIVLMAAGNTPVLEWNIFNGMRTLSANIAVELPEAVQNSTHYRMLFLAALCLFAMTFVLNTMAEVVRQRFRKRAFQL